MKIAALALTLLLPALNSRAAETAHKVDAMQGNLSDPDNFQQFVDQSQLRRGGPDGPVAAAAPTTARPANPALSKPTAPPRFSPDQSSVPAWTPTKDIGRPAPTQPFANALAVTGVVLLGAAALRSFGSAVADEPQTEFSPAQEAPRFVPDPQPAQTEAQVQVDLEPLPENPPQES